MEIISQVPEWLNLASLVLTAITLIATVIAKLTASKADDETVSKFTAYLFKVIAVMPTLGMNPKTKAMQEQIKELQAPIETKPVVEPVQK